MPFVGIDTARSLVGDGKNGQYQTVALGIVYGKIARRKMRYGLVTQLGDRTGSLQKRSDFFYRNAGCLRYAGSGKVARGVRAVQIRTDREGFPMERTCGWAMPRP